MPQIPRRQVMPRITRRPAPSALPLVASGFLVLGATFWLNYYLDVRDQQWHLKMLRDGQQRLQDGQYKLRDDIHQVKMSIYDCTFWK